MGRIAHAGLSNPSGQGPDLGTPGFGGNADTMGSEPQAPRSRDLMIRLTCFCVAAVFAIGVLPTQAADHREALTLRVDFVEGNPAGIGVGDEFRGMFEADESILLMPDGVHEGKFVEFNLTVGPVNWNESHVTSPPEFLINNGMIVGVGMVLTDTMPAHPNLTLALPSSPGTWRVDDENDPTGQPIIGGNIGGTYTLEFIPDAAPALEGPWLAVLAIRVLIPGVALGFRTRV